MNAASMVSLARNWTLVPDKIVCHFVPSLLLRGEASARGQGKAVGNRQSSGQQDGNWTVNLTGKGGQVLSLQFLMTEGSSCQLAQLEHVQVSL